MPKPLRHSPDRLSWRHVLLISLAIVLLTGSYGLHRWLPNYAIAIITPEGWQVIARGWACLLQAWPVVLLGGLLGGFVAWISVLTLHRHALNQDQQETLQRAEQALAAAETRAEQAEQRAAEHYHQRLQELTHREVAAHQAQQQAHTREHLAEQRIRQAEQAQSEAEARRQRAYHGFKRLQKKLARQNSKIHPTGH